MERRSGRPDMCSVNAHGVERLGVHDIEAAASIHQYFGETLRADDWVDHEWVSPRLWDVLWVKVMADSDHRRKVGMAGSVV